MTKDDIIKILNKYYDPKQMELDQYNWNDYFKPIANEILALQPTDEIAELKQRISELESELKQIYDKPNINHP